MSCHKSTAKPVVFAKKHHRSLADLEKGRIFAVGLESIRDILKSRSVLLIVITENLGTFQTW